MGMLEAAALGAPGNLGLNTQDSPIGLSPQFATETYNTIIDEEGRLACRKGFVALGNASAFMNGEPAKVIYQHYLKDGTNDTIFAGNGNICYDENTPKLILDYGCGAQEVNVGGTKTGASTTGLANDATNYTVTVTIDGVAKYVAVTGSTAQTYTNLLAQINTDLGAAGTAFLFGGNIRIRSATSGASSSVAISADTLFSVLTGYVSIGTAQTPVNNINNWQFATLNGHLFAAVSGYDIHGWDETEVDYGKKVTIAHSTFTNPNTILSAYGRLFAADVSGDDYTVYWSVLENGKDFNGVGAGAIDMTSVFVDGKDSIVSLAAHNNRLMVFCRKSVYIFSLPTTDLDPANMVLEDVIQNNGCIARDSVVSTGDDILWLSSIGVQSLQRRVQYDTLPMTDYSRLIHQTIINRLVTVEDLTMVRGFYFPVGGWYLLCAPTTQTVWVFHMAQRVPEYNTPRVTQWNTTTQVLHHFATNPQGQLLCASTDGVWLYNGYGSLSANYPFRLTTGWLPLGDPTALKHFKKVLLTMRGGSGQIGTLWWSKDFKDLWQSVQFTLGQEEAPYEWNEFEYTDPADIANPGPPAYPADFVDEGFYTIGNLIDDIYMQIGGSAKFIRFRIEITIEGELVSLYNITTFDTRGKIR
jgi:hypothetical protein